MIRWTINREADSPLSRRVLVIGAAAVLTVVLVAGVVLRDLYGPGDSNDQEFSARQPATREVTSTAESAPWAPASDALVRVGIEAALGAWIEAIEDRSFDSYLASYSKLFYAHAPEMRASWTAGRRILIEGPERVSARIESLDIESRSSTATQVRLLQIYDAGEGIYRLSKQLTMVREGEGWKIARETTSVLGREPSATGAPAPVAAGPPAGSAPVSTAMTPSRAPASERAIVAPSPSVPPARWDSERGPRASLPPSAPPVVGTEAVASAPPRLDLRLRTGVEGGARTTVVIRKRPSPVVPAAKRFSPALLAADPESRTIQISSERTLTAARTLMERLGVGLEHPIFFYLSEVQSMDWYLVLYGNFSTAAEARQAVNTLPADIRVREPLIRKLGDVQARIARLDP